MSGRPNADARRHRRAAVGVGIAAVAVAVASAALWIRAEPLSDRVDIGAASVAVLDTVRLDGRRVTASLDGTVQAVGAGGTVWVGTDERAFAVRGDASDSLSVEDRVLVVGLVREDSDGRYLDAEALAHVVAQVRPGRSRSGERPTVQPED